MGHTLLPALFIASRALWGFIMIDQYSMDVLVFDQETHRLILERVNGVPAACPHCHEAITPSYLSGVKSQAGDLADTVIGISKRKVTLTFECPRCRNLFISLYKPVDPTSEDYRFALTVPSMAPLTKFEAEIPKISPRFVATFHEAERAEGQGIKGLAGDGYQKALEFLVKDFLLCDAKRRNNDLEYIRNMTVAECIEAGFEDVIVKKRTRKIKLLQSDEGCYYTRTEGEDLASLKELIRHVVSYIVNVERFLDMTSPLESRS